MAADPIAMPNKLSLVAAAYLPLRNVEMADVMGVGKWRNKLLSY